MKFSVIHMHFDRDRIPPSDIEMVPFTDDVYELYKDQYVAAYDQAFFPMRKALDIEPYNCFGGGLKQLGEDPEVFLLTENGILIGSVECCKDLIDDLFVSDKFRGKGYGRKILIWAMNHVREQGYKEMKLSVAVWNRGAMQLYLNKGFEIVSKEEVNPYGT